MTVPSRHDRTRNLREGRCKRRADVDVEVEVVQQYVHSGNRHSSNRERRREEGKEHGLRGELPLLRSGRKQGFERPGVGPMGERVTMPAADDGEGVAVS